MPRTRELTDDANCFHGAASLLYEHDGRLELAIRAREREIDLILDLQALAEKNVGDRAALVGYEAEDLAVRQRILAELVAETDG